MNVELLCDIVSKADKNFELALVPAETLTKFAELLIKECASLADSCPADYLDQPNKYPSTWIEEHFGVKA